MSKLINNKDLSFLLYDVFNANNLSDIPAYADHDQTTYDSVIKTAQRIAEDYFANHNSKADEHEPQFDGEKVSTIPEVKEAWKHFSESGLLNARHSYDDGGMQLPALINSACCGLFTSANPGTAGYPFLTSAAANVIQAFGSDEQKAKYLPGMFNGRFSGTMALTEPDVGSSLGDLTTKAIPQEDGSYKLKGQKMYISGGDQDITENIVHLVLARVEGANKGVKGISLFITPKFLVNDDGSLAERNDVKLAGLLHKMGYRGTTSTVLSFGEEDNCTGYLIGEEGKGLGYMFKMMNEARIGVGLGAAMIGYRGYLESLDYAKNRPQGRKPSSKDSSSKPLNIVEHADVKRMLLAQKSYVEGSLALCLFASRLVDEHEAGGHADSGILLDLLTPIVKSFPSSYGLKANDYAIQVLGGAGYIREYPVEQCYRDNRLNPIHEGTYGIQSLDLLGRKLWMKNSQGLQLLMERVQNTLKQAKDLASLAPQIKRYQQKLNVFSQVVMQLGQSLQSGKVDETLANSALFLDMMGKMVVAWLWIEMASVAQQKLGDSSNQEDQDFVAGKVQACRYFIEWELGEIEHQAELLKSLDSTCADMQENWF
ncbi:acyl-CoA dehydrogenase [Bermanella marisrubri]|uniref:Acyl-CoA dehydrogenase n=1 Tax=Bermanella marisrubri TaxID=207949 RepID=Q1N1G0_9GAMM|nr:acyl-CoA dehydrogenase [Bermanella marisrubri]EAT12090.1 Acyl-CoA dehydrogenase [Oceanobacter sp. RED65] [Bermanella marisrubri]QIZ83555.1 acyl-CoA dehydrogenase [Bermanella marisrubri]